MEKKDNNMPDSAVPASPNTPTAEATQVQTSTEECAQQPNAPSIHQPSGTRQNATAGTQEISTENPHDRIRQLQDELKALQDKYLRVLAEFENYKRRSLRERQQLIESANADLMLDLTEVRENIERALKTATGCTTPGPMLEGLRLIHTKLDEVLGRHGLEPFGGEGEEFDPTLHDAMMRASHAEIPEGHIAQVIECGYRLKGQILKHARVVVSAGVSSDPPVHGQPAAGAEQKE